MFLISFLLFSSELLNATLWAQTAPEHTGIHMQAYRQARTAVERALKDRKHTAAVEQTGNYRKLPPAIILDIDETVLDNSPSQARDIRDNATFTPQRWNEWVQEAAAKPLPGALEFTRWAAAKGIKVFFVTNREKSQEEATRRNLARVGFPLDDRIDTVLTRGEKPDWGSDKGTRRAEVAARYRILLLVGDDFGDFLSNVRTAVDERRRLAAKYEDRWGTSWIALPNAMYGSWESALFHGEPRLGPEERRSRKLEILEVKGE